jgi:hypothetical protein
MCADEILGNVRTQKTETAQRTQRYNMEDMPGQATESDCHVVEGKSVGNEKQSARPFMAVVYYTGIHGNPGMAGAADWIHMGLEISRPRATGKDNAKTSERQGRGDA